MPDILQIRNQLKSLSDEQLQQEMSAPTGGAPEYMLLAEVTRRGEMRSAYEGEKQRRGAGQTTVAEDVLAAQPPIPPAGIDQAGPQAGLPSFAYGGTVGSAGLGASPGYGNYRARLDQMLANSGNAQRDNAATAILRAGLGIAGGQSPNFATNVARGGLGALDSYSQGKAAAGQRELNLLKAGADLTSLENSELLRRQDMALRERLGMAKIGATRTKTPESERRIANLMKREGMSRQEAEDLTYGHVSTTTGETGDPVIVNRISGESRPVNQGDGVAAPEAAQLSPQVEQPAAEPEREPAPTLWSQSEKIPGVTSFLAEGASRLPLVSDALGDTPLGHVQARQLADTMIGQFTKAMATNPRFSDGERNQLRKELDIKPSLFDQPTAYRARLQTIDKSVRRMLANEQRAGRDRNLSKKDRLASRNKVRLLENLLDGMGVPARADPMNKPLSRKVPDATKEQVEDALRARGLR